MNVNFNPRLTKLFFVTRLTKGVVATLNELEKINTWGMLLWYHDIAMGLLFPYIPKKYKHPVYDVITTTLAQIADFQWNIDQNWIFRQKVLNIRIHQVCCL